MLSKADFMPSLLGTMSAIGGTYIGASIDRKGFSDVLAFYAIGALNPTNFTGPVTVAIKVQESADNSTWSDITNGAYNAGSFAFSTVTLTSTQPQIYKGEKYERFDDANRKQWIRMHATVGGTVGFGPKVCAGFLLSRPVDTYYVGQGSTQGTGGADFTIAIR